MSLKHFVKIRQDLIEDNFDGLNIKGNIKNLTTEQADSLKLVEDCVLEIKDSNGNVFSIENLNEIIGNNITLELASDQIPNYFESFENLINKHPYSFDLEEFYVHEEKINQDSGLSGIMKAYRNCLSFILFLSEIADNKNSSGADLELYFHKIGKSLILPITYTVEDLKKSKLGDIEGFLEKFNEKLHAEDKKRLFINDLVDFFSEREKAFSILIVKFRVVKENYLHSFDAYLEGFSFEKIKTSSLIYFQEISDKIHETIRKVSSYLFAIPIAFLFLASRLDFENPSLTKNLSLLILGYLFFILIWKIFFKNIKESLDSVYKEIIRFQKKIENVSDLSEIKDEIENEIKGDLLQSQYKKLCLLKGITVSIVVVLTMVVVLVHWELFARILTHFIQTTFHVAFSALGYFKQLVS
ncbi:hypothetical protein F8C76_11235 [Flagellimonas olearia]|uniref:Uncharacterized protein n=1 Tax=Flagellimonas olearia TaxID=552546 RepID=A0A6I1DVT5_9FLAO|nr:hypothetical protein [Allomuricauda olearia]KAB7528429.1 hypothetical protein F8C76_11235 [Allomuricauda olearia]